MPRRCCIPGCKVNYDSTLKETGKCESTFAFPKDPEQVEKWLKAIPRKDWQPSNSSVVCSNHFCNSDILRYHEFSLPSGEVKKVPLKYPKLSKDAVPRFFKNLPKYLSNTKVQNRSDPEKRRETISQREEEVIETFLKSDMISDFKDLKDNFMKEISTILPWEVKIGADKLYFYTLNLDSCLSINSTIIVDKDLQVQVVLNDNHLSPNELKWVLPCTLKLERWSQLQNLLSRYKLPDSAEEIEYNVTELLKQSIKLLSKAFTKCEDDDTFLYTRQLELILDQLTQIVSNKNRYCPATIIMSFIIYSQSPSCYNLIRDFFILPHKRYIQSISSSLSVSPTEDSNNKNYLLNISKSLSDTEKVIALIIDEIYITSRVDYRSQSIVGSAENEGVRDCEFAKTIVTFMISSVFGSLNEVVKLWPVNNVKGLELAEGTKEVVDFVQECGFEVICIITDNHSINRIMFKSLSDNGFWFNNPKNPEKLIFLLFDFIHIFKNIWKNWLNLKNLYNTFVFYDFEHDSLKYAKLQDVKNIYEMEKDLLTKKAYKLNYKSLYPSTLERQKVHLADNVFHQSTISGLRTIEGCEDTADFLEIIRHWWDIVNTRNYLKGTLKRNDWSKPFQNTSDFRIDFLNKFVAWLDKWHSMKNNNGHLTNETCQALKQSTTVLIKIIQYSFQHYSIKYVLPGKFTSENLEKRFGIYRILSGCNYNVSLDDVLSAEKKIRMKHIFKNLNHSLSLSDIKAQFSLISENDIKESFEIEDSLGNEFLFILQSNYLQVSDVDDSTKIYISGYASHTISKKLNQCENCISLLTERKGSKTGNEYFDYLQRDGLSVANDRVTYVFVHMVSIMQYIMNNKECEVKFLKCYKQKDILCKLTIASIQSDFYYSDFLTNCSRCNKSYFRILNMLCSVFSNICLNNYVKIKNNYNIETQKLKNKKRLSDSVNQNSQTRRKLNTFSSNFAK